MKAVLAWLGARPVWTAAGLYAVVAVVFFSPGLVPGHTLAASDYLYSAAPWKAAAPEDTQFLGANYETSDQTLFFLPFMKVNRERIGDGVPRWNPDIMGGRPYFGNAQAAPFSPLNAISYVLPFWKSLAWIAILKAFTAAFGAYLLARALALRQGGALLAGLIFGFGLFFVIWVPWPTASVWAFLPWMLLLTDLVVRRPGVLPVAGLSVVIAAQYFSGHPESSFHTMFMALAFAALRVFQLWRGQIEGAGGVVRAAGAWVVAAIMGSALAAVAILPFAELLSASDIVGNRGQTARSASQLKYLFTAVLPDYYGRATQRPLEGLAVTRSFYFGAFSLMLAAIALLRPTLERLAAAGFAVFCLCMVFAIQPIEKAVALLPGFSVVHNTRMTILYLLCAGLLAGWGLDDLTDPKVERRRWIVPAAAVALVLPVLWVVIGGRASFGYLAEGLDVAWGFATPPFPPAGIDIVIWSSILIWVVFAAGAVLLLALQARGRLGVLAFTALALLLVTADLFRAGMGQNTAITLEKARQPTPDSIKYLQSRTPGRFVGAERKPDAFAPDPQPLPPDVGMEYGLNDARGYDYPIEGRYDRLWERTVKPEGGFVLYTMHAPINARSLRTLNLLGVTDILQSQQDKPLKDPSLSLVYDRPDARVYANSGALPRAWVVGAQTVVRGEAGAFRAVTDPRFDPRRAAVVEKRVDGVPRTPARGSPGTARIGSYRPEHVKIRARAARDGSMLVLSDTWFPGWKAKVDGREVPIERVDYLLRGVKLPAGAHDVEFVYQPTSFRIGWIVSLLAFLALGGAVGRELWRRRRGQAVR